LDGIVPQVAGSWHPRRVSGRPGRAARLRSRPPAQMRYDAESAPGGGKSGAKTGE